MATTGKTGVSSTTTTNIMFGSGTIHKGLTYTANTGWNFDATIVGATNGGSKLSIIPEITTLELDGVDVRTKGLDVKTGGTASLEVNFAELTKDIIKAATFGQDGTSEDSTMTLVQDKTNIAVGDYWTNIAFVGLTLDGRKIIAILPNAICTSGFEAEGKSKEGSVGKYTFECTADPSTADDLSSLPWKIYYPNASST